MSKLWLTGDSFSVTLKDDDPDRVWLKQVAKGLGDYELKNCSYPGTCQDWAWGFLELNANDISSDDQIIVVLTEPSRYWFFEEHPTITNSHILDFDKAIDHPERVQAVELFIKHIQRHNLDYQHCLHRLGWLNNMVHVKKWKKPLIIHGANQNHFGQDYLDKLNFSIGNLTGVSFFEKGEEIEFRGFDMRYNHLCLSNHDILAEKVINALTTGERLDLTTGFIQGIYTSKLLDNPTAELSPTWIKEYQNAKQPPHGWFERFGWIPKN